MPNSVHATSVTNAAGVLNPLAKIAQQIRFLGDSLEQGSEDDVRKLVAAYKNANKGRRNKMLLIDVGADDALRSAEEKWRQIGARIDQLADLLQGAGLPKREYRLIPWFDR